MNFLGSQSLYQRLIMKNSFKISKDIFTSKVKDNFLKFSMLLVKGSKFIITKNSKIRELLEEQFQFNKKDNITRIYVSL